MRVETAMVVVVQAGSPLEYTDRRWHCGEHLPTRALPRNHATPSGVSAPCSELASMKEILYVQAGPLANFIGTHFWNTQESYFTYGDGEEPVVHHDRSFREGLTPKVTLFPLMRANFPKLTSADKRESQHSVRGC